MRAIIWLGVFVLASPMALAVSAPGTVEFDNTSTRVGDEGARIVDAQGTPVAGPSYWAQLYVGTNASALTAVGVPEAFLTGEMAGYVQAGPVAIPFVEGGLMAHVQLRAWEARGGSTFEAAVLSRHWSGISSVLQVMTGKPFGGVPIPAAMLRGLVYPGKPIIIRDPRGKRVVTGESAALAVFASGGVQIHYQWYQGESGNLTDPIEVATNAVYTAAPLTTSNYWVRVYTSAGSTNSATATVTVIPTNAVALDLRVDGRVPVLTVDTPTIGQLQLQFSGNVNSPSWATLTNINLATNRLTIVDTDGSNALVRFYRGVILH